MRKFRGLIWGSVPAPVWKNVGKLRKISMRIASPLAEIWSRELPNTNQECHARDLHACCMYVQPNDLLLSWWRLRTNDNPSVRAEIWTRASRLRSSVRHELQMFRITCKMMITGFEVLYLCWKTPAAINFCFIIIAAISHSFLFHPISFTGSCLSRHNRND
jgi:hypothetical protein